MMFSAETIEAAVNSWQIKYDLLYAYVTSPEFYDAFYHLPQPFGHQLEYIEQQITVSLDTIVMQENPSVDGFVQNYVIDHIMEDVNAEFIIVRPDVEQETRQAFSRALLLGHSIAWNVQKGEPKKRKWESFNHVDDKVPQLAHFLRVSSMLPEQAPTWVKLAALCHDYVEDSYRHKLLERKFLLEQTLGENDQKILDDFLDQHNIPLSGDQIANYYHGLQAIVRNVANIIGLEGEDHAKFSFALPLLSKKKDQDYWTYLHGLITPPQQRRILDISDEVRYWSVMIKLLDRAENAHIPFDPDINPDESFDKSEARHLFYDGLKSLGIVEVANDLYRQLQGSDLFKNNPDYEQHLLEAKWFTAHRTMVNMAKLMNAIKIAYKEKTLTIKIPGEDKARPHSINFLLDLSDQYLMEYFEQGKFTHMDAIPNPDQYDREKHNMKEFNGTLQHYHTLVASKEKNAQVSLEGTDHFEIYTIGRAASIVYLHAALSLGHIPFAQETVQKKLRRGINYKIPIDINHVPYQTTLFDGKYEQTRWGLFNSNLMYFQIENFMEDMSTLNQSS